MPHHRSTQLRHYSKTTGMSLFHIMNKVVGVAVRYVTQEARVSRPLLLLRAQGSQAPHYSFLNFFTLCLENLYLILLKTPNYKIPFTHKNVELDF